MSTNICPTVNFDILQLPLGRPPNEPLVTRSYLAQLGARTTHPFPARKSPEKSYSRPKAAFHRKSTTLWAHDKVIERPDRKYSTNLGATKLPNQRRQRRSFVAQSIGV
jgi:hypothetical protein